MIEGIIKTVPETTSDIMESVSAARRAYAAQLPSPEDPIPREFDESRSLCLKLKSSTHSHTFHLSPSGMLLCALPFTSRCKLPAAPPPPSCPSHAAPLRQFLVDWAAACATLTPSGAVGGWTVRGSPPRAPATRM